MEELLCLWFFFWFGFFVVFLGFFLTSTYVRSTIFYLLETSGKRRLPSGYHLPGESSKIFSGQTLSNSVLE